MDIQVGDKVRFKDSYDGTFQSFKGRILTVKSLHGKDPATDGPTVQIREIENEAETFHLILLEHFEAV